VHLRVAKILAGALVKPKLGLEDASEIRLRVWPNDIDVYPERNNGRHWTIMDLGRYDLAARTRLMRMAHRYSFAQNYKTIKYYRHDPPSASPDDVLSRIRTHLSAGHPAMFGFTVYSSIEEAYESGLIPFPSLRERIEGGHAVVAVGYDDKMKIKNKYGDEETTGALLIRNSWGGDWGEAGFGWLPYEYIKRGLAEDFWSVLKKEWIDTGEFQI